MRAWSDCLPCMLTMAVTVARKVTDDEEEVKELLREVMASGLVSERSFSMFTPEIVRDIWLRLVELGQDPDPLREERIRQNEVALSLYPEAKAYVEAAPDPLLAALKLSIAGNMLDAMVQVDGVPPTQLIEQVERLSIADDTVNDVRRRLARASNLVWFTDNCGEIVFDRVAIEVIKAIYPLRLTVVTRTVPVINDALLEDALAVGLDKAADAVLENGIEEPLPSTRLIKLSADVRKLVDKADLIISKGVGNYELLSEEESLRGRTTFLMQGKCPPVCRTGGVEKGGLVVLNY